MLYFITTSVVVPVISWISKVLTADSGLYQIPYQFPGLTWENVEHYWERPSRMIGKIENILAWFEKYKPQEKEIK